VPETLRLPSRLHHTAYVVEDLERTRHFYEDLIGLPLIATYCEVEELLGAKRVYCHCFFGLADGGALAFFQFANHADFDFFTQGGPISPRFHVAFKCDEATQSDIHQRLVSANYERGTIFLDHGYCKSLYVADPDGLTLEFTLDSDRVDPLAPTYADAHGELVRWLGGNHASNNPLRRT